MPKIAIPIHLSNISIACPINRNISSACPINKNISSSTEVMHSEVNYDEELWTRYRIPGIFRGIYISRLSMKQGFSRLKFRG